MPKAYNGQTLPGQLRSPAQRDVVAAEPRPEVVMRNRPQARVQAGLQVGGCWQELPTTTRLLKFSLAQYVFTSLTPFTDFTVVIV